MLFVHVRVHHNPYNHELCCEQSSNLKPWIVCTNLGFDPQRLVLFVHVHVYMIHTITNCVMRKPRIWNPGLIVYTNLGFDLCTHNPRRIVCTILGLSNEQRKVQIILGSTRIQPGARTYSIGYGSYNNYSLRAFLHRPTAAVSLHATLIMHENSTRSPV